jgi:hypothetical protein
LRDKRVAGGIAVALVLVLAFWLLFIRTPDGANTPSGGSSERGLAPTFPREASTSTLGSESAAGSEGSTAESTAEGGATTTTAPEPTTSASVTDPSGDLTFSVDPPPPWADLAGATLTRSGAGYELRVKLGGGAAPTTTDATHTMNIASFYDVDGDGTIDYEVWANIASGGWGGSYFDNRTGGGAFVEQSLVDITVQGDEVVITFPLAHLQRASTFRWSLASEWGSQAAVGTDLAARDDAPDNDAPTSFPG